jgi:hypothetical protein
VTVRRQMIGDTVKGQRDGDTRKLCGPRLRIRLSGRSPEELELDVVRVSEDHHRVRRVVEILHARVRDAKVVQPLSPLVKVLSPGHQELQMVKTGSELAEDFARVGSVTDKTEHEPAARLGEADVAHTAVVGSEVVALFQPEHAGVPGGALNRISNRQVDFEATCE